MPFSQSFFRDLSDEELVPHLRIHDPRAEEAVRERYDALARAWAARACGRHGHRGGRCPGADCDLDLAFASGYPELLDWWVGRGPRGARKPRTSLLVTWYDWRQRRPDRAEVTFSQYVGRIAATAEQVLRAWNRDRGVPQRFRKHKAMDEDGPPAWRRLLAHHPGLATAAAQLAVGHGEGLWVLAEALYRDACDTGLTDPIDRSRVTRFLLCKLPAGTPCPPFEEAERLVAALAPAAERLLTIAWPHWTDAYLDRPRQQTRRSVGDPEAFAARGFGATGRVLHA